MTPLLRTLRTPTGKFAVVFACCFAIGGANHAFDLLQGGVLPYHTVPLAINAFWSVLCPVDLALAALIWFRYRTAINLGVLVMVLDVGLNSWVGYFSGIRVSSFEPLQVQSVFLGFVLAGALLSFREVADEQRLCPLRDHATAGMNFRSGWRRKSGHEPGE